MTKKDFKWKSFRDLATATEAAKVLDTLYGDGAAEAAIASALAAAADRRPDDHRFWLEVARCLSSRWLY